MSNSDPNITFMGKILVKGKVITAWKDGDTVSFLWNWWNPVSWLFVPVLVLYIFISSGIAGVLDCGFEEGFTLSDYWKENKDKREFLK
jgi:hypothetical protein